MPIDDYARLAVQLGIRDLAITDHLDFDPAAPAFGSSNFATRERTVRSAADKWGDQGVTIHFGVEITWARRWEQEIRDHLAHHTYDFVIGSVHQHHGTPFAPENVANWVKGRSLSEIVSPYFDEVAVGARSALFDAMGHLDFVKGYLHPHVTAADLAEMPELYDSMLVGLVETGTALEINTSGLRHTVNETYPSQPIVARFRALGGQRITIGSDAHTTETFAWALGDGYDIARISGFDALMLLRGGERVSLGTLRTAYASERAV